MLTAEDIVSKKGFKIVECAGLIEELFEFKPATNTVSIFSKYFTGEYSHRREIEVKEAVDCLNELLNNKNYNVDAITSIA